jgi:hypothetical protein
MINEKRTKVGGGGVRVDRVLKGKVQRKKLKSNKKGFKVSGNKIVRMNPSEKRKRSLASRKGARKRRAKLSSILRKRKISIRRGKRSGLYK